MRINQKSLYYLLPLLIFLFLYIFWQKSINQTITDRSLPIFNLPTLYHSEKRLTNEDLKGKMVLVNFWASWCSACQKEHSVLMSIKEDYHIPIFGINYEDSAEFARIMLGRIGNPYIAIAIDEKGDLGESFRVNVLPQTFLIDAHGKILYRHIGILSKDVWESIILPLMQPGPV